MNDLHPVQSWVALLLPRLPVDLLTRAQWHEPRPIAVVADRRILACDGLAGEAGVRAGQKLSAALALCPPLVWRDRDMAAEKAALADLAGWASRFTSQVALAQPQALLLELGGSVRLFGGLAPLLRSIVDGLADLGFHGRWGIAPTPQGALLLARSAFPDVDRIAQDRTALRQRLIRLPVAVLEAAQGCLTTLEGIGARVVADLLALPRDGLNRRFGATLLDEIDRALGVKPDPRLAFVPPSRFETRMELAYPTASDDALLFVFKRLFDQLEGVLRARRAGTSTLMLTLRLDHVAIPLVLTLSLLRPADESKHFCLLLRERLARTQLAAPVEHITVTVERMVPLYERPLSLLPDDPQQSDDLPRLLERLNARLGDEALRCLRMVPDHRPERASQTPPLHYASGPRKAAEPITEEPEILNPRPFWLLTAPQPLREVSAVPHLDGPLTLLAGPERIESGWWDADAARDYFVAATDRLERVWVFRERKPAGGWFLHGYFA